MLDRAQRPGQLLQRQRAQHLGRQRGLDLRALALDLELRALDDRDLLGATLRLAAVVDGRLADELLNAQAEDERARLQAQRKADEIDLVEAAKLRAERERAEIQAALPPDVLRALALQELAGALGTVEHLTVTPDLLAPLLAKAA